jgi:hypothetical protein
MQIGDAGIRHVSPCEATTSRPSVKRIECCRFVKTRHLSEDADESCLPLPVEVNTGNVDRGWDGRCEELDVLPTSPPITKRAADIAGTTP